LSDRFALQRETARSSQETERLLAELRVKGRILDPVDGLEEALELADQAQDILRNTPTEEQPQ